jgi:hypothetical protein
MKLPSNQFQDAGLAWSARVVNPVRLMAMFARVNT